MLILNLIALVAKILLHLLHILSLFVYLLKEHKFSWFQLDIVVKSQLLRAILGNKIFISKVQKKSIFLLKIQDYFVLSKALFIKNYKTRHFLKLISNPFIQSFNYFFHNNRFIQSSLNVK